MCNLIAINYRDTVLPQYCDYCALPTSDASSQANKQHCSTPVRPGHLLSICWSPPGLNQPVIVEDI